MIVAANFKTNKTRKETLEYLKKLDEVDFGSVKVAVFPPSSALFERSYLGAQNAYPTINGAYTGEIGLEQIEEYGIKTILIGHSERRHILGESQEFIAEKFNFFKKHSFEIFYCIGESLEVRKKGLNEVIKYLKNQLIGIDLNYEKLIIAYEPVWAIGTGISASLEEIKQTHKEIRKITNKPILYGGSVKVENIKDIISLPNVNGVLVGSASLKVENFIKMIEIAKEVSKR
jgi:triosephosphate isomerase